MITDVPATPVSGVKVVIVGTRLAETVNAPMLVAEPVGVVILIGPVVAAAGTTAMILFAVGVPEIVAATPLNLTAFCAAVVLKPVPWMVTAVPVGPVAGVNCTIETAAAGPAA